MKSESEVSQLCPTLSDPMDCIPPGASVHGIFQARLLEWGAIAYIKKIGFIKEGEVTEGQFSSVQSLSHVQLFATP